MWCDRIELEVRMFVGRCLGVQRHLDATQYRQYQRYQRLGITFDDADKAYRQISAVATRQKNPQMQRALLSKVADRKNRLEHARSSWHNASYY